MWYMRPILHTAVDVNSSCHCSIVPHIQCVSSLRRPRPSLHTLVPRLDPLARTCWYVISQWNLKHSDVSVYILWSLLLRCGKLCRRTSRRRHHELFVGNAWRLFRKRIHLDYFYVCGFLTGVCVDWSILRTFKQTNTNYNKMLVIGKELVTATVAGLACRSRCVELTARTHPCWTGHSWF